ncbi:Thiol:disulfide interchange protein DsbC [hydrothermal vent metagenome]|uniref:Thiol:disulfide interchange protein DsbC n=1 Tax=hydrothermal vent metagenome TaxID=652676 RepID=A0A3B0WAV9_9ZZZZ
MKNVLKFNLITRLTMIFLMVSSVSSVYAEDSGIEELRAALAKTLPQAAKASITKTPVEGLYQVMAGSQIMYMTKDARYILEGDLYDMQNRKNITEDARGSLRLGALNKLGEDNMLVYLPKGKVKHTITVFTDIYCPYCRKLHNEMGDYMNNGVKVRYIFVPFKGAKSVQASVSVWCAKDRTKAMDLAKSGKTLDKKTCDNPVSKHQALAAELGIRGTPAIMLENGTLMPGYVPSNKVIEQLNTDL